MRKVDKPTMRLIKLLIIGNWNNASLKLNVLVHFMPILWLTVIACILKERYFMILTK